MPALCWSGDAARASSGLGAELMSSPRLPGVTGTEPLARARGVSWYVDDCDHLMDIRFVYWLTPHLSTESRPAVAGVPHDRRTGGVSAGESREV